MRQHSHNRAVLHQVDETADGDLRFLGSRRRTVGGCVAPGARAPGSHARWPFSPVRGVRTAEHVEGDTVPRARA